VIEMAQVRAVTIVNGCTVLWIGCIDKVARHGAGVYGISENGKAAGPAGMSDDEE
jgi:hypothetical protein